MHKPTADADAQRVTLSPLTMTARLTIGFTISLCVGLCVACAASLPGQAALDAAPSAVRQESSVGAQSPALSDLLARHWAWSMWRSPTWASELGFTDYNDRLDDLSPPALADARATARALLAEAQTLSVALIDPSDQRLLRLLIAELESQIAREVCDFEAWSVNPHDAALTYFNRLPSVEPLTTPADGARLLRRYAQIPHWLHTHIAHLQRGASQGLHPNAESTRRVIEMLDATLALPLSDWPLLAEPLAAALTRWPSADAEALRVNLEAALTDDIRPALTAYRAFLADDVLPSARPPEASGLTALPNGPACYAALIQHHTTLPLDPKDIHAIGLAELDRINQQMQTLGQRLLSTPDLPATLLALRQDPSLYFSTEQEVEDAAAAALAAAKAKIPDYFGRLPQADCVVTRIPPQEAPYTTIAYYRPTVSSSNRPGEYCINTYQPQTRPRFEARALAYHESIPGHHLQIAIAQELPALPAFLRYGGTTAFVEGWALYTEALAEEMGLYPTDLDQMGRLSFEAWRASRLVVDTGLHAMGWSRDQAKALMMSRTALTPQNIDNEVDRYISWPGQALAYKTGELHIKKLRADATTARGPCFDIKSFHDIILGSGAVPLTVLTTQVESWLAAQPPCPR